MSDQSRKQTKLVESPIRPEHLPPEGELISRDASGNEVRVGKHFTFNESDETSPPLDQDPQVHFKHILQLARSVLKPAGFTKQGQTFRRTRGISTQWVNFQRSSWRVSGDPVRFTVNLAVSIHQLHPERAPNRVLYSHADFDIRIGSLHPDDRDIWWSLGCARDVETCWHDLSSRLIEQAIPMLDEAETTRGFLGIIARFPHYVLGDVEEWAKKQK